MKWIKQGLLYRLKPFGELLVSHAANPLPIHLHNDVFRIFFSGRDTINRSSVFYVDANIKTLEVKSPAKLALQFGDKDSFYSHGISIGNMFKNSKEEDCILFMGWQLREGEHWKGDIGQIIISKQETLEVDPAVPFMKTDKEDPISLSYPFVLCEDKTYKMWYGSTLDWTSENGEMIHVIKYATSEDGISWKKHGVAIPWEIGVAQAFSKPSVLKLNGTYHMWFSYRSGSGESYRIGYAKSTDGINWTNHLDQVGITIAENGWDTEMICYPSVFVHNGEVFMLYNGNSYGKEGFGLAQLDINSL